MKYIFLIIFAVLLVSCEEYYEEPAIMADRIDCVKFVDDYGEREVCNTAYYYDSAGDLVYWDAHFGVWIGHGFYYDHGVLFNGYYPHYHEFYHHGYYHTFHPGWHGTYHYYHGGHHR